MPDLPTTKRSEIEERYYDALLNILDITRKWSAAKRLPLEKQMELIDKYASEALRA